jgi:hypothetical protein
MRAVSLAIWVVMAASNVYSVYIRARECRHCQLCFPRLLCEIICPMDPMRYARSAEPPCLRFGYGGTGV